MSKKKVKKSAYVKELETTNRKYFRALNAALGALQGYDEVGEAQKAEHPEGATVIALMTGDLRKRITEELNK